MSSTDIKADQRSAVHAIRRENFFFEETWTVFVYVRAVVQFVIAPGLPFIFLMNLVHFRFLKAPEPLATWTTDSPRYTLLGTTVVASFLSWLTQNTWGQIITLLARKRSLRFTPIVEVETLTALKSGGVVLDVAVKHLPYTSITAFTAFWIALLTAGYTTLLTPLSITETYNITGWEPDFLASDSSCPTWFAQNNLHDAGSCTWVTIGNISFTTCADINQALDVLEIGRSAMVKELDPQLTALGHPPFSDSIPVYNLDGVHFNGRTGGIVPQGPGGVSWADTTNTRFASGNTTMRLQGLSAVVSCQATSSTPIQPGIDSAGLAAGVQCPGGGLSTNAILQNASVNPHLVAAVPCNASSSPNQVNTVYYIASLGDGDDERDIGNISCDITSSIVTGTATYSSVNNSFSWVPDTDPEAVQPAFDMADQGISDVASLFSQLQLIGNGNLMTDAVNSIYYPFVQNRTSSTNTTLDFPTMLSEFLRGVLEYEASWLRSLFMIKMLSQGTNQLSTTNPCSRNVTGVFSQSTPGWDISSHTAVAFVPIAVIAIMTIIMMGLVVSLGNELPIFNPTSHVSLATAVSSAKDYFSFPNPQTLTVHPRDEQARFTRVAFKEVREEGGWVYLTEHTDERIRREAEGV